MDDQTLSELRGALDAVTQAADERQAHLDQLCAVRFSPGEILAVGRTIDTLERIGRELAELLDHPPRVGGAGSVRLLPRPQRPDDPAA